MILSQNTRSKLSPHTRRILVSLSLLLVLIGLSLLAYNFYIKDNPQFFINDVKIDPENPRDIPEEISENIQISTPKNFKVAFIADQGITDNSRAVLKLIKNEETDMLLIQGDFDYYNQPNLWENMLNQELGTEFPVFASIGNHDTLALSGYQKVLQERLKNNPNAECTGETAVRMHCIYKGLEFVTIAAGLVNDDFTEFIDESLNNSKYIWKICSWHKNQHLMQTGDKTDEVGWDPYQDCLRVGAIVATGHEHSYSRTYLMSDFQNQVIVNKSDDLVIQPGQTFAFVSGLGGHSVRDINNEVPNQPWWASTYNSTNGGSFGALFCEFNTDSQNKARCYFKDINGKVIDEFTLTSKI